MTEVPLSELTYMEKPKTVESILKRDFSEDFVQKMRNRIATSHFKYGWAKETFPDKGHALGTCMLEILSYYETGNLEYLVDAANYCLLEFKNPSLPYAHFEATDSHKSPGMVKRVIKPWEIPRKI
jgi:hypothetical protein